MVDSFFDSQYEIPTSDADRFAKLFEGAERL
jgi:hypothetical protein